MFPHNDASFKEKYGPWALVIGGSIGLGAEFSEQIASRGINCIIVARGKQALVRQARHLEQTYGITAVPLALDIANPASLSNIRACIRRYDCGLMVYNAAVSPIGRFLELDLDRQLRAVQANCSTMLSATYLAGNAMAARGRGGIILMSSMAGLQGSPMVAVYGATKAFTRVLGEGLWYELRPKGVDVLAFCAGATRTPNYEATAPRTNGFFTAPVMEPGPVVREALSMLGKKPSAIAGGFNTFAGFLMGRVLSRTRAVTIMGDTTTAMYG